MGIGKGWLRGEIWIKGDPCVVRIHEGAMGERRESPKSVEVEKRRGCKKMDDKKEEAVEWKLELEEFEFAGCMDNHVTG